MWNLEKDVQYCLFHQKALEEMYSPDFKFQARTPIMQEQITERKLPSAREIHKPHGNSYARKHQQGRDGTDK